MLSHIIGSFHVTSREPCFCEHRRCGHPVALNKSSRNESISHSPYKRVPPPPPAIFVQTILFQNSPWSSSLLRSRLSGCHATLPRKEQLLTFEPLSFPDLSQSQLQSYFMELSPFHFLSPLFPFGGALRDIPKDSCEGDYWSSGSWINTRCRYMNCMNEEIIKKRQFKHQANNRFCF